MKSSAKKKLEKNPNGYPDEKMTDPLNMLRKLIREEEEEH